MVSTVGTLSSQDHHDDNSSKIISEAMQKELQQKVSHHLRLFMSHPGTRSLKVQVNSSDRITAASADEMVGNQESAMESSPKISSSRNEISDEEIETTNEEEKILCQGPCGNIFKHDKTKIDNNSDNKQEWLWSKYCSDCQSLIINAESSSTPDIEEEDFQEPSFSWY